ncbi:MAG: hypothetical protein RLZZ387_1298 [Chloroflexota bacterium]
MSFQKRGAHDVVVCDVCSEAAAVGDTRMRLMRHDASGHSHHLCSGCRVWAEWCQTHQRYHLPDDLHRTACTACGGLFTAQVRLRIAHCPSCLREQAPAAPVPTANPRVPSPPQRGLAGLFASLAKALRG